MDSDSSAKFIGSLTKFLQSLCNGYVDFQRGVELVGHIYLSIDTGEKVDYILHEKVSKSDENSVTFVSNSFHAQPLDKDKDKTPVNRDASSKSNDREHKDTSDDDDIMIVNQTKGIPGSTNTGSIPVRGMKRVISPGADQRHSQRARMITAPSSAQSQGSSNQPITSSSGSGNWPHSGRSATITGQSGLQQENLNISDVKLEQISKDELLSLASQVGEGEPGPSHSVSSVSRSQPQHSGTASASGRGDRSVWIKQEATDDNGGGNDTGWSQGRDESNSNSSSNLYPVMLHQNPAYSGPVFPGFSGPSTSGAQSAANPFINPMPGTSQDLSGLDPAALIVVKRVGRPSSLSPLPSPPVKKAKRPVDDIRLDGAGHLPEWTTRNRCLRERQPIISKMAKKSNSDKCREYRAKLAQDPERLQAQRQKDMDRNRRNRKKPKSEEEKARIRELAKLRMQKSRAKRKAEKAAQDPQPVPAVQPVKRTSPRKETAAVTAQRQKWAAYKRKERAKWSAQKWRHHREKTLQAYYKCKEK